MWAGIGVRLEGCAGCGKGCRLHSKLDGQPGEDSKQRIPFTIPFIWDFMKNCIERPWTWKQGRGTHLKTEWREETPSTLSREELKGLGKGLGEDSRAAASSGRKSQSTRSYLQSRNRNTDVENEHGYQGGKWAGWNEVGDWDWHIGSIDNYAWNRQVMRTDWTARGALLSALRDQMVKNPNKRGCVYTYGWFTLVCSRN